jgi:signal recognition particle subunit SEC65
MFNLSEYQTCAERLELFWKEHPDGRIDTKLIEATGGRFIVQAYVYRTEVDQHPWASGLAEETIAGRGVNATSALENAETSALARALANAGYSPKGDPSKRASREEMSKVEAASKVKANLDEVKAKMADTSGSYIPVVKEEDPWTIKPATMPPTMGEAVSMVKEIIGGQTEKDIPKCKHGDMVWKTGTSKTGNKPWGHFKCMAWVTGELGGRCEAPNDVIWYEISKEDGTWQRQKGRV